MSMNPDGIFYRVNRDGEWQSVCFTNLTIAEREKVTEGYKEDQWKRVALHLAERLKMLVEVLEEQGYFLHEEGE